MAETKSKSDLGELPKDLTSPVQLMEKLSISGEVDRGNTPRPSKASMLFVSGMASVQKKNFEAAFNQLTQSVKEAELDKKNKEVLATSLCGLGYLCDCLKQYDRAAICYKRSLKLWEKLHAGNPTIVIPFIVETSTVLQHAGKYEEAYELLEKAKQTLIKEKGENNTDVHAITCALANIKFNMKKYEEAEELYTAALKSLKELNDPNQTPVIRQLILVKQKLNKQDEIASLEEQLKKA